MKHINNVVKEIQLRVTHKSLSLISEDTSQPQPAGELRNQHFEEIHCSILMLSKVPRSIFSTSRAEGRDDGRSAPERGVDFFADTICLQKKAVQGGLEVYSLLGGWHMHM